MLGGQRPPVALTAIAFGVGILVVPLAIETTYRFCRSLYLRTLSRMPDAGEGAWLRRAKLLLDVAILVIAPLVAGLPIAATGSPTVKLERSDSWTGWRLRATVSTAPSSKRSSR